jgi:hypothetical protein
VVQLILHIPESKIQELIDDLTQQMEPKDIKWFESRTLRGATFFASQLPSLVGLLKNSYPSIYKKYKELNDSVVQSW